MAIDDARDPTIQPAAAPLPLTQTTPHHPLTHDESPPPHAPPCGAQVPLFEILLNVVTRQLEFAADRFSCDLGLDIRPALLKLSKTNLENADPDPLLAACRHSHPVTTQRIAAITKYMGERNLRKAKQQ